MRRKTPIERWILVTFCGLVLSIAMLDHYGVFLPGNHYEKQCAFCQNDVIERQMFYEGEHCMAMVTYKPATEHHFLVLPKRHVERFEELSANEMQECMQVIKRVSMSLKARGVFDSYFILEKNGVASGQHIPHVHFHCVPRKSEEKTLLSHVAKFLLVGLSKPNSKEAMQKEIAFLQESLNHYEDQGVLR